MYKSKAKPNKNKLYFFIRFSYDHPFYSALVSIVITIFYFLSLLINVKLLTFIINLFYIPINSYILCSIEFRFINHFGNLLDSYFSKVWKRHKVNSWGNLSNIERFYKINWKNDLLNDLLNFFNNKHILPSEEQMNSYIDSSGNINDILLYKLLVDNLQELSINEITIIKNYIELKSSKHVYQRYITLTKISKTILLISTLAFTFTISGTKTEITVDHVTIKNPSTGVILHTIAQVPNPLIIFILFVLMIITTVFVTIAFYNAKHLRYINVVHQALTDAYSIKSNHSTKE